MSFEIISQVYEASIITDKWPAVLQTIADEVGALSAAIVTATCNEVKITPSYRAATLVDEYVKGGWQSRNEVSAPLMKEMYPGFRTKTDYWTIKQLAEMPVEVEFFRPRGCIGGAATMFQGAADHLLQFTVDGFATHEAAAKAVPLLDGLRSHLGRAFSLSALMHQQQAQAIVLGLEMGGVPAAIVDPSLTVRAVNDLFAARLGDQIDNECTRLRFANANVHDQFVAAARARSLGGLGARSLPVHYGGSPPCVLHLLPLTRAVREQCGYDGTLLIVAEAENCNVPDSDLLRLLFDLTPAQANLTRLLLDGHTIARAAATSRISVQTAKVHLRAVYAKTGVSRQAELVRLLTGLGAPKSAFQAPLDFTS